MAKRQVFYSFHFDNDVMRVQQIRNIGVLEGNTPVSPNEWEEIKRKGDAVIENWIDENMKHKNCIIVLIGQQTAQRRWVRREIEKAWEKGKALMGIYIHNLRCPRTGTCTQGANPFDFFSVNGRQLSSIIQVYNPNYWDAYNDITNKIEGWIESAIRTSNTLPSRQPLTARTY